MGSCFFTGHRRIDYSEQLEDALDRQLRSLINDGVTSYYTGGVPGWDMLCAMRILQMKNELGLELHMILLCPPELQCVGWSLEDQFFYNALYHGADSVDVLFGDYRFDCMSHRNRRLAECGDICLCWYDKSRGACNTGQTVRYAEEIGRRLINMRSPENE